ncbi:MAG: hypothetical protein K2I09_07870 [Duncaniella sp.]|nr:hypothetical protein [Duncaniella sp.]
MLLPIIMCVVAIASYAQTATEKGTLRTTKDKVVVAIDGKKMKGGWDVLYGNEIDSLVIKGKEIIFTSDIDTLRITLDVWKSKDFTIISDKGGKAPVRVIRISDNIYENPDPRLLKRAKSGMLSREQAIFDINALVYGLSEVHPDMFSVCRQEDFFRAVNSAIQSMPDSISTMDLFRKAAPIVAMIGDGHTNLTFPFNDVMTLELKRMPCWVNILSDKTIECCSSLDSIIPRGAKILSINGVKAEDMLDSMLPYVAGEKEPFKLSRIDGSFAAFRHMLYPAESFDIVYLPKNEKKPKKVTYPATLFEEVERRSPALPSDNGKPYSFTIDKKRNVAIMDFREFSNKSGMETFADSMFRELRNHNIDNLIIDLRRNGGGNSAVGDVLLRYISPVPFIQMDKALVRITPLTRKLMKSKDIDPSFSFYEMTEDQYKMPLTEQEGHYNGNVYLLTSNKTFSSAGSFAWAFKECDMGKVIGEETGGMNVCYGDILSYRLPVSRLSCTISYKRFWQFRADESDIHGTIPDVAVPAADALDKTLQIIKKKK